jgi:hypothetical protein
MHERPNWLVKLTSPWPTRVWVGVSRRERAHKHTSTHTVTRWPVLTFKILIWDMLPVTQIRGSPLSARNQAMLLKARCFGNAALVLVGSTVWALYLVLFVVRLQPAYNLDSTMRVEAAADNELGQSAGGGATARKPECGWHAHARLRRRQRLGLYREPCRGRT